MKILNLKRRNFTVKMERVSTSLCRCLRVFEVWAVTTPKPTSPVCSVCTNPHMDFSFSPFLKVRGGGSAA